MMSSIMTGLHSLKCIDERSQMRGGFSGLFLVDSYVSPQEASNIHAISYLNQDGSYLIRDTSS